MISAGLFFHKSGDGGINPGKSVPNAGTHDAHYGNNYNSNKHENNRIFHKPLTFLLDKKQHSACSIIICCNDKYLTIFAE